MSIKNKNKRKKKKACKKICRLNNEKIILQEKEIFDLKQLLEVSKSLNSVLEFDRLIEALLYSVMAQLRTLGAAIFTRKSFDDDSFVLYREHYGFDILRGGKYAISIEHPMLKILEKEKAGLPFEKIAQKVKHDKIMDLIFALNPSFFIPLKAKNKMVGFLLLGEQMEAGYIYNEYERELISNIASLAAIAINNSQLLEMTTTDVMTHLKLKHFFYTVLTERLDRINNISAEHIPLSILMFDIDFFKKVNDTYGHAAGDAVLEKIANIIIKSTRTTDMAARYGGEEFVLMLDDTPIEKAEGIAERIRQTVENTLITYNDEKIKVTVSAGAASYNFDFESAYDLVNRADQAMYESKQNGRNRVSISKNNMPVNIENKE